MFCPDSPNWTERAYLGALKNNKRARSLNAVTALYTNSTDAGRSRRLVAFGKWQHIASMERKRRCSPRLWFCDLSTEQI